jgi:hypothetical protein
MVMPFQILRSAGQFHIDPTGVVGQLLSDVVGKDYRKRRT